MKKKNKTTLIMTLISIFAIIVIITGATFSYFAWRITEENETNITVRVGGATLNIVGDNITNNKMYPTTCDGTATLKGSATATAVNKSDMHMITSLKLRASLFPTIGTIDENDLSKLHWAIVDTTTATEKTCLTPDAQGTFENVAVATSSTNFPDATYTDIDTTLTFEVPIGATISKTYEVYVWLDESYDSTNVGETISDPMQDLLISVKWSEASTIIEQCNNCKYQESILHGTDPELESGMIPVTISDTGAVTVADITQEWYNYGNKEWANAVLVNSTSRSTYINQDGTFNANTPIPEANILAYYVWIPRYKYTFPKADGKPETISIIFENNQTDKSIPASGKASGTDYYTHPAFTFGTKELNGIWVGKFETTGTGDSPTILPNEKTLGRKIHSGGGASYEKNNQNIIFLENITNKISITQLDEDSSLTSIRDYFDVALKFSGGTRSGSTVSFAGSNIYGLTEQTDSHMMKNSEWGTAAYLSHSIYGKNSEITINTNSSFITGSGNGTSYGSPTVGDYPYPQSTTGNITGIFDMSGGINEYVMGNYNGTTNTYFSTLPDSKYYNKYTVTSNDNCTLVECGGHALYETAGWYQDSSYFVGGGSPWFIRGGISYGADYVGAFSSYFGSGNAYGGEYGFRPVLVKGE